MCVCVCVVSSLDAHTWWKHKRGEDFLLLVIILSAAASIGRQTHLVAASTPQDETGRYYWSNNNSYPSFVRRFVFLVCCSRRTEAKNLSLFGSAHFGLGEISRPICAAAAARETVRGHSGGSTGCLRAECNGRAAPPTAGCSRWSVATSDEQQASGSSAPI